MNTHLMLPAILLVAIAGCSSGQLYPGAGSADSVYNDIVSCAKNNPGKFRQACRKEYQDSTFSARVTSVKTLGVNYITLFAEMGDPNHMINCSLKGAGTRDRIEKAVEGDVVKLRATPSEVSFGDVTFVHFEDCDLE